MRTPKVLGKEGQNTKKNKEFLAREKRKEFKKCKERKIRGGTPQIFLRILCASLHDSGTQILRHQNLEEKSAQKSAHQICCAHKSAHRTSAQRSAHPKRGRINGGGFLKNCAMATVLFISAVLKHFLKISQFWGPVPLMRWNTLGATPTAQNTVIEKFPKLCTASSCGLSPKSCNQVEVQLCNHWQTQMGKCIGQSHTPWGTFLSQSATARNPLFCSV